LKRIVGLKHVDGLRIVRTAIVAGGLAILAACATKPPPPPPPPPPIVIPPEPTPPMGAPETLNTPPKDATGNRITVNSNLSPEQAVWNLRSAFNVAALNCVDPEYAPILANYKIFLKAQDKYLLGVNKALDKDFRSNFGNSAVRERETYNTSVYNYFALPPVSKTFCDTALTVSNEIAALPGNGALGGYAPMGLARMEAPFRAFFDSYDQYRADLAAWRARYGGIVVLATPDAVKAAAESGKSVVRPSDAPIPAMTRPTAAPAVGTAQPAVALPYTQTSAAAGQTSSKPTVSLPATGAAASSGQSSLMGPPATVSDSAAASGSAQQPTVSLPYNP